MTATTATKHRARPGRAVLTVVAVLVALVWAFPVYWMISSSLMSNVRLSAGAPKFWPVNPSFDNYASVWGGGTFLPALRMSLAVTALTVVCTLLFAFLASLAISRFRFRGRTSFILAVLVIQMLPAEGLFIAQYRLMGTLHLLNTVVGISIIYVGMVVPFTVWMLRGFVAGVPLELEEAGMVDGLSRFGAFLRITFPLLAPGLVASGVYAFLQAWNEFTTALVVLQADNVRTLPLWLRGFIQTSAARDIDWGQVMAASTLIALPVIVFFLFVQGRMTSGLVSGAVKG
ncbi:MAG: carbohydrate ABC transporter permease [Cellulomonas sp.]|uniref:carbohydrate ABC transporter permease n=1 Tax=Cellulomonas sp. 73-92 TaxID=1895740 RepID=UPI00092B8F82|nr:carbohydrate ABC transporter permease [Cellulomonas sp. 73-92]MBN9374439.1 carbohydrate ABC transporter permease [Cellulomonas sp.]OJV78871.1 MAG: sugar ABC transporter permease [Cellulomonas sp. 73-92]